MDAISIEILKKSLQAGKIEVTFRKVNGDLRVMTCTTNKDLIPPSSLPINEHIEEELHRRNVRVYDVHVNAWRSFILDNIQSVKVL